MDKRVMLSTKHVHCVDSLHISDIQVELYLMTKDECGGDMKNYD